MSLSGFVLPYACAGIAAVVLWGTFARNRWGINLGRITCPRCLRPIPNPGGLSGLQQRLFGGGTCSECKTLVDKWGHEIMPGHRDRIKSLSKRRR